MPAVALLGFAGNLGIGAYTGVMVLDDSSYIRHAAIANFQGVPVEDLGYFAILWEVLVD